MTRLEEFFREIPGIWEKSGTLPHERFNALVEFVARNRLLGARVEKEARFRRPWATSGRWDAERECWVALVRRGWVCADGEALTVRGSEEESLIEWSPELIEVFIDRATWRPVTGAELPEFFWRRGVEFDPADKEKLTVKYSRKERDYVLEKERSGEPFFEAVAGGTRKLMKCDLVLRINRTRANWMIEPDSAGVLVFSVTFSTPSERKPRLLAVREFTPGSGPEIVFGGDPDEGIHERRIARLYALSPEQYQRGDAVDEAWEFFADHDCFWNLAFGERLPPPPVQSEGLSSDGLTGLAAGVGDRLIRGMIDAINRENALAELAQAKVRVESFTWTI